jgi:hypothetical protein
MTDNEDGTVKASVSGSDPASSNQVYTMRVVGDQDWLAAGWVLQAGRTGDGDVAFPLAPGYYWAYCSGAAGGQPAVTAPDYFSATDGLTPVQEKCVEAVMGQLALLTFTGTQESPAGVQGIYDSITPVDVTKPFPRIEVSVAGEAEEWLDVGMNLRDDYWFPVRVDVLDANDSGEFRNKRKKILRWRIQIATAFSFFRPDSVPGCLKSRVIFAPSFDPMLPEKSYIVSGLTVAFNCRLPRGLFPNV